MLNSKKTLTVLTIFTLIASSFAIFTLPAMAQNGPVIDRIRIKVIRSPDAQVLAMKTRDIDMMCGMIRPEDVEDLDAAGKEISSTSGFHLCNFIFNLRPTLVAGPEAGSKNPLHDVNFRHALFTLMPKARIVGSLFRYVNVKLDSMVPASMSEWQNTYVDEQPFSDPASLGASCESVQILEAAGYTHTGTWPDYVWEDPEGDPLTDVRVYIPLESVAPTSYSVGAQWVDQCHAIGLTNIILTPEEFSPYINKMYNDWNFEIGWSCYSLGRFPDYLYDWFHSSENYMGSGNPSGIYWPALDAKVELLKTGLDHNEKVQAAKDAQMLIAGGTPDDPLPTPAPTNDNNWNWSLARMPVYNRNYYDAQQPELRGAVNMRGYGLDILNNQWTAMNVHWSVDPSTIDREDPDGSSFYINLIDEYPERMNRLWSKTVYAAIFYQGFEGLIDVNPWTHHDEPWLATDWEYMNLTGESGYPSGTKMGVRFWLRDDVTWQDGTAFTVDDVKFAWEFLRDWQFPNFLYLSNHIISVSVDYNENSVTAFMDRTSQWDLYDLAGTAAMLPPQVWEDNPVTGDPWTDVTEIESFDPAQLVDPGNDFVPGNDVPTYLYGTGPFVFQFYDQTGAYGDLDANRDYWMTTEEIQDKLQEYLWRSGDTDSSTKVYAEDMATIGLYFGQKAEICEVDGVSGGTWTQVGASPYLHRPGNDDYIHTNVDTTVSADYSFSDSAYTKDPDKVLFCFEVKRKPMDMGDYSSVDVEVYNGTSWTLAATVSNIHAGWQYRCVDVTSILDTYQKVNAAEVKFTYRAGGTSEISISYAYLAFYDFNFDADITGALGALPDGKTDTDDLVTAGKFFGETISVPWP